MPGKRRDNILIRNLFVLLAFPEMAAQSRFLCIVYFEICIPMHYLAGKTHELKDFPVVDPPEYQWCTRTLGRVLDTLHEKLGEIIAFPSLFLSEKYMMNLFSMRSHHSKTTYSSCSTTGGGWSRTGLQACVWNIGHGKKGAV